MAPRRRAYGAPLLFAPLQRLTSRIVAAVMNVAIMRTLLIFPTRTAMTIRSFPLSRLSLSILMAFGSTSVFSQTSDTKELTAPTVEVSASADASAGGLTPEYQGGQVATGGRAGV